MSKLPKRYLKFMETYPEVGAAYQAMGAAVGAAGPLDPKTAALVKVGIAVGAKMEGAARSNAHKALEAGATPDEIRHAVLQATTTVGFPTMMAGMSWVDDVLDKS
ncbi:MAG: carboxymuconolactone decarboxylase family protein [Armatimonadetes bacterium]|nr:carboxymuconolactone decarboxylase family protein [Armatimonadota bacterium]